MFSFAVISFIIVQGIFPFKEARPEEYFYNLLNTGQTDLYWQKVNGNNLSDDFKKLIMGLFQFNGKDRPTLDQVKAHPWLNKANFDFEGTRTKLLTELNYKKNGTTLNTARSGVSF